VPIAATLTVAPDDLAALRQLAGARQAPAVLVQRAKIHLLAAEGVSNTEIGERLGISRPTVIAWRRRFAREGLAGLADRPRPSRPQTVRRACRPENLAPPSPRLLRSWGDALVEPEALEQGSHAAGSRSTVATCLATQALPGTTGRH
jgi:DNA-binding CsgD family transcriptional regulator